MSYRPEIDGLRTVAVIPVILFHAGLSGFSGGFVGVDVFFVISGYLITTILVRELDEGRYSLLHFYERRARRILPALFLVMAATVPFALSFMNVDEITSYFKALIAVCLFVSNILFWQEVDYFATASELNPLLHTWSLAVEEQYYLLFPPLLALLWRFERRTVFLLIIAALILSLITSEIAWRRAPDANFYLAPTRAWELLIGSVCAFLIQNRGPMGRQLPAALGLLMVIASIFLYDDTIPFPSVYALLPTLGTALIILFANGATITGRLLSLRPMVAIGLISYSAYLWHQPLFAFARIRMITEPTLSVMLALSLVSLGLAYLSWRFVETPFRAGAHRGGWTRSGIFAFSGTGMAAFMCFGLYGLVADGFPNRIPPTVQPVLATSGEQNPVRNDCFYRIYADGRNTLPDSFPANECTFPSGTTTVDAAIVGDSHAASMAYPIIQLLNDNDLAATAITSPGCAPFPGFDKPDYACTVFSAAVSDYLLNSDVPTVIYIARYATLFYPQIFDNGVGGVEHGSEIRVSFTDPTCTDNSAECRWQNAAAVIRAEFERLSNAGKRIVLVYPVPEAGWHVPNTYAKVLQHTNRTELSYPIAAYNERYDRVVTFLDSLEHPNIQRVRPADVFCDTFRKGACVQAQGDDVYYTDDDHLSQKGGSLIAPLVVEAATRTVSTAQ